MRHSRADAVRCRFRAWLNSMRIVYHHRTQGRGAEGLHIMSIVRALERAGHEVQIVSPPGVDPRQTAGAPPVDKSQVKVSGVSRLWGAISRHAPQILFELAEIAYNFAAFPRLVRVLRTSGADLLYERNAFFLFAGALAARRCGVPLFLEVNEVVGFKRARKQYLKSLARWIESKVFRSASALFAVSTPLVERASQYADRGRVHLMPNGVDPERFVPGADRARIRRERGHGDAVVAGFVGWFDEWDRLPVLLDVLHQVRDTHPELRIMLVGDGPVVPELKAKIEQYALHDRVILTGAVPRRDVPAYIDAMDICVLPDSNVFGSPMVLFEFMAMGKAVVVPDLGPIVDVVNHGSTAMVFPRGDFEAMKNLLCLLCDRPELRTELGATARGYILSERTWDANAREIIALAQQAAKPILQGSRA